MAKWKDGPVIARHGQAGKGDRRRQTTKEGERALEQNGVETFGDDWAIPPVLRRRRQQQDKRQDQQQTSGAAIVIANRAPNSGDLAEDGTLWVHSAGEA